MNISKPVKILIGILTAFVALFPFLYFVVIVGFILFMGFAASGASDAGDPEIFLLLPMLLIYPLMMCYVVVQFGLQIFYIVHNIKNRILTDNSRILFILGTFFMPFIAMPIYYIVHLWKDPAPQAGPPVISPSASDLKPGEPLQ